jgi:hypothetical protein
MTGLRWDSCHSPRPSKKPEVAQKDLSQSVSGKNTPALHQLFDAARSSKYRPIRAVTSQYRNTPTNKGNQYAIFNPNARNILHQRKNL